ncbi:hypothetical protein ABID22_003919 [Pontibacter aydingkolensis]|uniref:Uncharacterized protein n=1 Tax=Pontibacter aydingkolensis TaxID=1911536 RepID=A0ABS7CZJ8_9BACT|nr:hypothetical protein [Pontibacter aydingkolensis]MBW7469200.1 hypothetical protein [Pontibacter aydingkolensis]
MKTRFLSFAIALVALFAFGNADAQKANPKISNPDKADVVLSGGYNSDGSYTICVVYARVTGCGNASSVEAQLSAVVDATSNCSNKGQNKQDPTKNIPGQLIDVTGPPQPLEATNGAVIVQNVCVTIDGGCKSTGGNDWENGVTINDVQSLTLLINGKPVSLNAFLDQLTF